jgi:hypothetical protein
MTILMSMQPTPLYFMDEIDAALDFRNVSIVANYIKDRTKNAQFIIISLRNDMFELSHRLIGIYKTSNTTKSTYSLLGLRTGLVSNCHIQAFQSTTTLSIFNRSLQRAVEWLSDQFVCSSSCFLALCTPLLYYDTRLIYLHSFIMHRRLS